MGIPWKPSGVAIVILALLLGSAAFLAGSARAAFEWHVRDDATGGDCTNFATWDSPTKTCTMTTDVDRMIVLDADGLTLDGNGHSINRGSGSCDLGPYSWCAVKATGHSGLTIENIVVMLSTGGEGIWLENSPDSRILNNTLHVLGHAIHLFGAPRSTVKGNVVVNPSSDGCSCIYLENSGNLLVADNQVSGFSNGAGIDMLWGGGNVFSGNTVVGSGIRLQHDPGSTLIGNTATGTYAIQLKYSDGATITGNTATSNLQAGSCGGQCTGIYLESSSDARITGNTATGYNLPPGGSGGAYGYGLWLQDSPHATISENTLTGVGESGGVGITLLRSGSSVASGNTVRGSHIGIHVRPDGPSGSNLINGNTFSGSRDGIVLDSQSATTISENKVTVNGVGIQLVGNWGPPSGNLVDKNEVRGAYVGIGLGRSSSSNLVSNNVVSDGGYGITGAGPLSANVVKGNLIARNRFGMDLSGLQGAIEYNQVYYNCFLNNNVQLNLIYLGTGNVWNDGGNNPSGGTAKASPWGNHWSDYQGLDDGSGGRPAGDGVGDTGLPHQSFDSYPLMSPTMPNYGRVCGGNAAPTILSFTATAVTEGSPTWFSVDAIDGNGDALTYSYDFQNDGTFDLTTTSSTASFTFLDDFTGTAKVRVSDGQEVVEASTTVTVANANPTVMITGPPLGSLYQVGQPVSFAGSFTDAGTADTHTATWSVGDTTFAGTVTETGGAGSVAGTFTFTTAGIYKVTLAVVDDDGGVGTANTIAGLPAFVVVYDPNGGFVTGGGWINSPPGAYADDPTLTGKATFGFVAKYEKGKSLPTGNTEFQFQVAKLNFHATSYDWLVCGGAKSQFKGHGTINGAGTYGFLLTATDGQLPGGGGQDRFRIKIWDDLTGRVVYDNQMGAPDSADPTTVLGGGSIVIHKG